MRSHLKYYYCFWMFKFFMMTVFSFPAHAIQATCTGANHVFGDVDFGGSIQVKDSDPINTVLKEVIVNEGMSATCSNTFPWQGNTSENTKIGQGRIGISSFPSGKNSEICASNVPGIGYQLVFDGPGSGWLWEFGPKNRCLYNSPLNWTNGAPLTISSVIASGAIKVRLIKIGQVSKNPTTLDGNIFSLSRSHGPLSFSMGLSAKNTVISSKIPTCTFTGPSSRAVNFGSVESSVIQNNNAPYKLLTLLFSCEAGAKFDLAQLQVDGTGVSNDRPGLVNIDNTQAGSAQNVLIELVDAKERRLPFKQNVPISSLQVISSGDTHNIPFRARLYSEPGKLVKPGSISASLTFTLIQQ